MNSLRRFRSHCKGSVALIFAIAAVPLVVGAGLAVDYARALARRSVLQNRLDSAVTALVRETGTLSDAQIREKIMSRLEADAQSDPASGFTFKTASVARTAPADAPPELTVRASGTVATSLMKIIGIREVNIDVMTKATWSTADVVLVLENSGTMSTSSRMADLRTTVNGFISRVGADDNLVQVALVPHAVGVRVPTTQEYRTADWILFTGDNLDGEDGEDGEDGSPINPTSWDGCLTDRKMNYDTNDTYYNSEPLKKYPAKQCRTGESSLSTVIPLTSGRANFNAMIAHVNGMTAGGGTNTTIGVAWGHAMLSTIVPFTKARPPSANHRRIIILVSAHTNTKSRYFSASNSGGQAYLDGRTRTTCTAAKNNGIEIYTVNMSYSSSNDALLSECASTGKFADAANGTDVATALNTIAGSLRAPRLTH